jgi:hypothetical protein
LWQGGRICSFPRSIELNVEGFVILMKLWPFRANGMLKKVGLAHKDGVCGAFSPSDKP